MARLFDNTPYGVSVWVCLLYERFVCCRPLHRVAAWLVDMGLAISPGTLADSTKRFVPLFEPLAKAILAHQNEAALRHADETSWRVQAYREKGRSSRAWLWTSVSDDAVYFHIDPSRSAEVAMKLFGSVKDIVVLVCDRFSAYKKLARELGGKVILQWCWAHQRRSFIDCAAGHVRLTRWCQRWIERIALIYRLNEARLKHYDRAHPLERQSPTFDVAHAKLKKAVDELFAAAEAELAGLTDRARRAKETVKVLNLHSLRNGARLRSRPIGRWPATVFNQASDNTAEPGEKRLGGRSARGRRQVPRNLPILAQCHTPNASSRCFSRQCSVNAAPPSSFITRLKL